MDSQIPISRFTFFDGIDLQREIRILYLIFYILFTGFFVLTTPQPASAQYIIDNGEAQGVITPGTLTDLMIPENGKISEIYFALKGANGGDAWIDKDMDSGSIWASGGKGALLWTQFKVGDKADAIPPGSTIRFIVGARGTKGQSTAKNNNGVEVGGGGGGSAVLFKPPNSYSWTLLAVAGGGGGAIQFMTDGIDEYYQFGGDGSSESNGDSGGGNSAGTGGADGKGGEAGLFGSGGGGGFYAGKGIPCESEGIGGGQAGNSGIGNGGTGKGCVNLIWRNGGDGFGGGGSGFRSSENLVGSGGGGGGFSGGGGGGWSGAGGGGGSYIHDMASEKHFGAPEMRGFDGTIIYRAILNQPPKAVCKNATVFLNAKGKATLEVADIDDGSFDPDEVDMINMAVSQTEFACDDIGTKIINLIVTDSHGAKDTCPVEVIVADTIRPIVLCKNVTVQLDGNGMVSITPDQVNNGSSDNCFIESMMLDVSTFTCENVGKNIVTLTVVDSSGNKTQCTAVVTVENNARPIVRTRNVIVTLDKYGKGSVNPAMINNGSSGNCSIDRMWLEGQTEYDCGDVGEHEIVLKLQDQNGNINSHNAFVRVQFYEPNFENIHGASNGDTLHIVHCQSPWNISRYDMDYDEISQYGSLKTRLYKEHLPENPPWSMYSIWRYEYIFEDACAHKKVFNFFVALYDLDPPRYQSFPKDTIIASTAQLPHIDQNVKIQDICQSVVWDTVITSPIMDIHGGDTTGYMRRWMARDPSGHQSFRD